jgi:FkbM family methyltransferase
MLFRRIKARLTRDPDRFLRKVSGVIHVGANTGQERDTYWRLGLRVIWIEPIPEVFQALRRNLTGYSGQTALQYLVSDRDNAEYPFHIANNGGASSSILEFKLHQDIWPQVVCEKTIRLRSTTLPSLLRQERLNATDYQALILDTQGSELLILKGADPILSGFRFIKIEVPDFEAYTGCCQLQDIEPFMKRHGFREFSRHLIAERTAGGAYYDIVYARSA